LADRLHLQPCPVCRALRCGDEECREILLDALVPVAPLEGCSRQFTPAQVRVIFYLHRHWRCPWGQLAALYGCDPRGLQRRAQREREALRVRDGEASFRQDPCALSSMEAP